MALLLREAIGAGLRRARTARRRTLRDVSRRARVSLGYLSEVERGRKEPSSELLAAICEALDVTLPDLLTEAAHALAGPTADAAPPPARSACATPTCGSPARTRHCWARRPRPSRSARAVRWRAPPPERPLDRGAPAGHFTSDERHARPIGSAG